MMCKIIKTIFEIINKSLLEKIIQLECYTIFMRDLYRDSAGSKNSNYRIPFKQIGRLQFETKCCWLNLKPKENWDTRINYRNEKALNIFRKCISCERPLSLPADKKRNVFVSNTKYFVVVFSSPQHNVLKVRFCDGPLSVVHHPSVRPSVRACVKNFFKQHLL